MSPPPSYHPIYAERVFVLVPLDVSGPLCFIFGWSEKLFCLLTRLSVVAFRLKTARPVLTGFVAKRSQPATMNDNGKASPCVHLLSPPKLRTVFVATWDGVDR